MHAEDTLTVVKGTATTEKYSRHKLNIYRSIENPMAKASPAKWDVMCGYLQSDKGECDGRSQMTPIPTFSRVKESPPPPLLASYPDSPPPNPFRFEEIVIRSDDDCLLSTASRGISAKKTAPPSRIDILLGSAQSNSNVTDMTAETVSISCISPFSTLGDSPGADDHGDGHDEGVIFVGDRRKGGGKKKEVSVAVKDNINGSVEGSLEYDGIGGCRIDMELFMEEHDATVRTTSSPQGAQVDSVKLSTTKGGSSRVNMVEIAETSSLLSLIPRDKGCTASTGSDSASGDDANEASNALPHDALMVSECHASEGVSICSITSDDSSETSGWISTALSSVAWIPESSRYSVNRPPLSCDGSSSEIDHIAVLLDFGATVQPVPEGLCEEEKSYFVSVPIDEATDNRLFNLPPRPRSLQKSVSVGGQSPSQARGSQKDDLSLMCDNLVANLLSSMCNPLWTVDKLRVVQVHCKGDLRRAMKMILKYGSGDPEGLLSRIRGVEGVSFSNDPDTTEGNNIHTPGPEGLLISHGKSEPRGRKHRDASRVQKNSPPPHASKHNIEHQTQEVVVYESPEIKHEVLLQTDDCSYASTYDDRLSTDSEVGSNYSAVAVMGILPEISMESMVDGSELHDNVGKNDQQQLHLHSNCVTPQHSKILSKKIQDDLRNISFQDQGAQAPKAVLPERLDVLSQKKGTWIEKKVRRPINQVKVASRCAISIRMANLRVAWINSRRSVHNGYKLNEDDGSDIGPPIVLPDQKKGKRGRGGTRGPQGSRFRRPTSLWRSGNKEISSFNEVRKREQQGPSLPPLRRPAAKHPEDKVTSTDKTSDEFELLQRWDSMSTQDFALQMDDLHGNQVSGSKEWLSESSLSGNSTGTDSVPPHCERITKPIVSIQGGNIDQFQAGVGNTKIDTNSKRPSILEGHRKPLPLFVDPIAAGGPVITGVQCSYLVKDVLGCIKEDVWRGSNHEFLDGSMKEKCKGGQGSGSQENNSCDDSLNGATDTAMWL